MSALVFPLIAALMAGAALAFVLWPLLRKGARGKVVALAISLAFILPVTALGLYVWVGTPAALNPEAYKAPERPKIDLAAAVTQLQARLEQSPDDLDGWTLLARAYQAMQEPDKAGEAWARALQLAPDNPDILVASAEASSLAQPQHKIDVQARARLDKALQIDPDHQRALWLVGISDYQQGQYTQAASTWQHLLDQVDASANPKVAAAITQQIARARQAAGMPSSATSTPPAAAASSSAKASATPPATVRVHVSLAPDMTRLTDPSSTVFVFARAVEGPPMPLAVKRLTVADLPTDITLTDAMAMTPQMKLSMFDKVNVSARVSASGQAEPQTGDLEATAKTVAVDDAQPLDLSIDHAIK